jgi:hypothetical protein
MTLGETGVAKLTALCAGLGLSPREQSAAAELFDRLTASWSATPVGGNAPWRNDLTDDGTPFEFSVAFGGPAPEVRILVEAQQRPFTAESNWEAGLRLNEALRGQPHVDLAPFERVRGLFAPLAGAPARFSLWHAASVDERSRGALKAYLNLQIMGPDAAFELVSRALGRLGLDEAAERFAATFPAAEGRERPLYFSVDLTKHPAARAKVYVAHEGATAAEIEGRLLGCRDYVPGDAARWLETLTGGAGPFYERPVLSCFAFDQGAPAPAATLHVPVRSYVPSDAEALARACELMRPADAARLRQALDGFAGRPLGAGRGLITYVSLRREGDRLGVTTYLAPELFAISAPRTTIAPPSAAHAPASSMVRDLRPGRPSAGATMATVQGAIERHQALLAQHPFLKRLETQSDFGGVPTMASRFTFFVLSFPDILRLARARTNDPAIKSTVRTHELEEQEHKLWFLSDLDRLGSRGEMAALFSEAHEVTRDITYDLIAEVLRTRDDYSRFALLLSLEAVAAEFFSRAIALLERIGRSKGLLYFARGHQHAEESHDIFEAEAHRALLARPVPDEALPEVMGAVERTFACMTRLAESLDAVLAREGD